MIYTNLTTGWINPLAMSYWSHDQEPRVFRTRKIDACRGSTRAQQTQMRTICTPSNTDSNSGIWTNKSPVHGNAQVLYSTIWSDCSSTQCFISRSATSNKQINSRTHSFGNKYRSNKQINSFTDLFDMLWSRASRIYCSPATNYPICLMCVHSMHTTYSKLTLTPG